MVHEEGGEGLTGARSGHLWPRHRRIWQIPTKLGVAAETLATGEGCWRVLEGAGRGVGSMVRVVDGGGRWRWG